MDPITTMNFGELSAYIIPDPVNTAIADILAACIIGLIVIFMFINGYVLMDGIYKAVRDETEV